MAIKYMDGLEHHKDTGSNSDAAQWIRSRYYTDRLAADTDGPELFLTSGPFGGPCWACNNNGRLLTVPLPSVGPTFLFAGWFYWDTVTLSHVMFSFWHLGSSLNRHCEVYYNDNGTISVKRSAVTLGTTTNTISAGQWYHIALKYNIHDSTGFFELRVNDTDWLSMTAQDTKEVGDATIEQLEIRGNSNDEFKFAQLIYWDTAGDAPTDFFGLHKIWTLRPNGDSATADWAAQGAGANYVEVDEAEADDDTTYNESSTVADADRLDLAALPESPDTIYAVQSRVLVRQTEAGNLKLKNGVYSGTTESLSAAQGVGLNWEYQTSLETDNPDDSAPWEEADVNALQVQYETA